MSNGDVLYNKRGFLFIIVINFLVLHLVLSFAGVYTFIPELIFGLSFFDYIAFFLVFMFSLMPSAWSRVRLIAPYALMVILYYGLALMSSTHFGDLWKVGLRRAVILCTLLFSVPIVIYDYGSWRRFVILFQVMVIIAFSICIAEVTSPSMAKFLALGVTDGSTGDVAYHAFRPGGMLRNPNDLATYFLFTFLLSFWCPTLLRLSGFVVSLFGIYLSASRGGSLLFMFCIVIVGAGLLRHSFTLNFRRLLRIVGVGFVGFVFLFAVYLALHNDVLSIKSDVGESRIERILSLTTSNAAGSRMALWQYWLSVALDAPIHGDGLYSFQGGIYSPASRSVGGQGSHNMWIMLLGEVGFLGPLAFMMILLIGLLRILRYRDNPMGRLIFLLIWFVFVALSFKGHNQLEHRHWTIIMALILYYPTLNEFFVKKK